MNRHHLVVFWVLGFLASYAWSGGIKNAVQGFTGSLLSAFSVNIGTTTASDSTVVHISSDVTVNMRLTTNISGTTSTDGMEMFMNATDSGIRQREARNFILYTTGNEYFRIGSGGGVTFSTTMLMWSRTSAQLRALTNGGAGSLIYNSSNGTLCMSTGTAAGSWVLLHSTETACDD